MPDNSRYPGRGVADVSSPAYASTDITIINMSVPSSPTLRFRALEPDSVSETPSQPSFNTYDIPGRSSPPQAYSGGEPRSISFTLTLHRDLMGGNNANEASSNFDWVLDQIRALNYPTYGSSGVVPPKVYLRIGDQVRLRGYCTTSIVLKRPIHNQRFMVADVTFDFTEVLNISWSSTEILEGYVSRTDHSLYR